LKEKKLELKDYNNTYKKDSYFRDLFSRIFKFKMAYVFILPFTIVFAVFTLIPVITAIYYGFTYYNILQPAKFIGLGNYIKLFFYDDVYLIALQNTLIFAAISGPLSYFLCLFIAWFVNELSPKFRSFVTLLFYAPALTGAYYIWSLIFSGDNYGYLNSWLMNLGVITGPIQWLVDPAYIKTSIIIVILWSSLGVSFLTFIAGFQSVDTSLYEAGAIDGIKNRYQELWFITLPSMKGQLMFSAVMSITASFGVGDIVTALCGFPSSGYAAHTLINHLQDYGTIRFDMGYACAIATILFIMMVVSNKFIQYLISKVGK
jgi:multiple sugar transport system permease protein